MKKSLVLIVAAILMLSLFGCSDKKNADVSGVVDAPDKFSTLDEAKVTENPNIRKESENVNGMCYAITLEEFTYNYNEMLKEAGNLDMINPKGWKMLAVLRMMQTERSISIITTMPIKSASQPLLKQRQIIL